MSISPCPGSLHSLVEVQQSSFRCSFLRFHRNFLMSRNATKLLVGAALVGAGYYVYEQRQSQKLALPPQSSSLPTGEEVGRKVDKATSQVISYADEKYKAIPEAINNSAAKLKTSAQEGTAAGADRLNRGVDIVSQESKSWISRAKGWVTGSK